MRGRCLPFAGTISSSRTRAAGFPSLPGLAWPGPLGEQCLLVLEFEYSSESLAQLSLPRLASVFFYPFFFLSLGRVMVLRIWSLLFLLVQCPC